MTRKGQRLLYAGLQNLLSLVNDRYINTADVEMLIYRRSAVGRSETYKPIIRTRAIHPNRSIGADATGMLFNRSNSRF